MSHKFHFVARATAEKHNFINEWPMLAGVFQDVPRWETMARKVPLDGSVRVWQRAHVVTRAAAQELLSMMPRDTVHCTVRGETWRCATVEVTQMPSSPVDGGDAGAVKNYVKFSHLQMDDGNASSDEFSCSFSSPTNYIYFGNPLLKCTESRQYDGLCIYVAERRSIGTFISVYIDASYLMLRLVQDCAQHHRPLRDMYLSSATEYAANECDSLERQLDERIGYLFLEYLRGITCGWSAHQEKMARAICRCQRRLAASGSRPEMVK